MTSVALRAQTGPDRRLRPLVGVVLAVALLVAVVAAGRIGELTDQQVAEHFVAALDRGDLDDVAALVSDDPTIITWMPLLPRPVNGTTMALIDVGRADRVRLSQPHSMDAYLDYYQGLATTTELSGCVTEPPRSRRPPQYDAWVNCRFASSNAVVDAVTDGSAVLRGTVRFGVEAGAVRAALVVTDPTPAFQPIGEFLLWVRATHPQDHQRWLRGRLNDPVVSAESAAALRRLAAEFAASGA